MYFKKSWNWKRVQRADHQTQPAPSYASYYSFSVIAFVSFVLDCFLRWVRSPRLNPSNSAPLSVLSCPVTPWLALKTGGCSSPSEQCVNINSTLVQRLCLLGLHLNRTGRPEWLGTLSSRQGGCMSPRTPPALVPFVADPCWSIFLCKAGYSWGRRPTLLKQGWIRLLEWGLFKNIFSVWPKFDLWHECCFNVGPLSTTPALH